MGQAIKLRHPRHFVAVAEELYFARAAERLGMEQSPLSYSFRNLEAELSTKLFHRTKRRTWLTRAGLRFFADTRRILGDVDAAAVSLRAEGEGCPERVSLALGDKFLCEPFTRLLLELEHDTPKVEVEMRELSHADAVRLVRDRGSDFALTLDGRGADGRRQIIAWGEPAHTGRADRSRLGRAQSCKFGRGCGRMRRPSAAGRAVSLCRHLLLPARLGPLLCRLRMRSNS